MTDSKQELSLQTTIPRGTLLAMLFSALLKRKIHVSKTHIKISSVPICSIKAGVHPKFAGKFKFLFFSDFASLGI